MAISRDILWEILGLESPKKTLTSSVKRLQRGPARLNRIRAFIEGQKDSFEQFQVTPSYTKKPEVIFCNGIFGEKQTDAEERKVVRALLCETQAYAWHPDEFSPPAQFLHQIVDCHADTSEGVSEKLGLRAIDPAKYIVVDYKKYCQMLIKYRQILEAQGKSPPDSHKKLPSESCLDLTNVQLENPKTRTCILQSVQPHEIHEFRLNNPSEKEMEFIFQHFPNVTQLVIASAYEDWFKVHKPFIKKYSERFQKLKLILQSFEGNYLTCPITMVPRLEIYAKDAIVIEMVPAAAGENEILDSFTVQNTNPHSELNHIEHCRKLTHFKFESTAVNFPSLTACSELRTLELRGVKITTEQLSFFPHLTELKLTSNLHGVGSVEELNLAVVPRLETLVAENMKVNILKLDNPSLKNLTVVKSGQVVVKKCGRLLALDTDQRNLLTDLDHSKLQSLHMRGLSDTLLNFSSFRELTSIDLENCSNLSEIIPSKKLQSLELALETSKPILLDASQCPQLRELVSAVPILSPGFDLNDFTPFKKLCVISFPGKCQNLKPSARLQSLNGIEINDSKELGTASYVGTDWNQAKALDLKNTQVTDLRVTHKGPDLCLAAPSTLNTLQIFGGCFEFTLQHVSQLQSLQLFGMGKTKVEKFTVDAPLNNLMELSLLRCPLNEFNLNSFPNLRSLKTYEVDSDKLLENVKALRSLEEMDISYNDCTELDVSTCENLISLELRHCSEIKKLVLPINSHLRSLNIQDSKESVVIDLTGQRCLRSLTITTGAPLGGLVNLQDCSELRYLEITAPNIFDLPPGSLNYCKDCTTVKISKETTSESTKTTLSQSNLQSSVTIFSPHQKLTYYSQEIIGPPKPYEAKGSFVLSLEAKMPIYHREFRKEGWNQIFYTNRNLSFRRKPNRVPIKDSVMKPFTPEMVTSYKEMAKLSHDWVVGYLEGELKPGETSVALMTDQAMHYDPKRVNFSPFCNANEPVSLSYDETEHQYYAESSVPQKIAILYLYQRRKEYCVLPDSLPELVDMAQPPPNFCPAELIVDVTQVVSTIPELKFLADRKAIKKEDIPTHIQTIKQYCSTFADPPKEEQLIPFLKRIEKKIGACEARCEVFMVLTRMMGVKTDIGHGELHARCEIIYPGDDPRKVDLGGSDVKDQTERLNPLDKYPVKPKSMLESKESHPSKMTSLYEMYNQIYKELVEESEIKSVKELRTKAFTFAPKLNLTASQSPGQVYEVMLNAFQEEAPNKELVFVNDPEEMGIYVSSYRIENGKRLPAESAFKLILDHGGEILMNWTEFDAHQRVTWQSMIDDSEPRIEGQKVDKTKIKIVGLDVKSSESGGAFLSRCQQCTVHPDFFVKADSKSEEKKDVKPFEIDLFHRYDWMESTLGKVDNHYQFTEGPLLRAIRENKPVHIYNPPEDERFHRLVDRINLIFKSKREHQVYFNGEWIKTSGCEIRCDEKEYHPRGLEKMFHRIAGETKKQPIYIGAHNFHELYELSRATPEKREEILPGFLKSYDGERDLFYFTEPIPMNLLCILKNYLKEHYPNKEFDYQLAPGAFLEGLTEPVPLIKAERKESPVIFSQDPDLTVQELQSDMKGEKPAIVHLTPEMGLGDLVGEQTFDERTGDFEYKPGFFLKALQAGPIILTGNMDPLLFQQLWPLIYGDPPRINVNGEFVKVKGPLVVVMPSVCEETIKHTVARHERYDFTKYRKYFPDDQKHMDAIEIFYREAAKIPRGPGMPNHPILSYARLKAMIFALKTKTRHPHNPIKGVFLHDYFKGSEQYAHLNVLGKFIFRPEDETPVRHHKLKRLLEKLDLRIESEVKKQAWRILNCLHGAQLKDYLDSDFKIKEGKLLELVQKVKYSELKPNPPEKKSHVKKRQRQLHSLISEAEEAQLILLMGEPGVGKTFDAKNLKNEYPFYEFKGMDDVKAWREDKTPGKVKVLFIDEANRYPSGAFDFLKSDLSPDHKVILAANLSKDPGRCRHELFDRAHVIFFEMPEDEFLREQILLPILGEKHKNKADIFLAAFHLAREHNPYFPYSNRELKNAAQLFKSMVSEEKEVSDQIAYDACIMEFAGSIRNKVQRKAFMEDFAPPKERKSEYIEVKGEKETLFFPPEKAYVIDAIAQALILREKDIQSPLDYFKRGILVEGKPGSGKSSLFEAMLYQKGLPYYKITLRNHLQAEAIMKKAFHEGLPLIIDELFLSPKVEALLDKMMVQGIDNEGNPPKKRGFMVFASCNPSWEKGGKMLPPAVLSRFQVIHMDPYDPSEFAAIAAKKIPEPELLVQIHQQWESRHPDRVNDRTFFNAVKLAKGRYHHSKQVMPPLQGPTLFQPEVPAHSIQELPPKPKSQP